MSREHKCILIQILNFGYFDRDGTAELNDGFKVELQTFGITLAGQALIHITTRKDD